MFKGAGYTRGSTVLAFMYRRKLGKQASRLHSQIRNLLNVRRTVSFSCLMKKSLGQLIQNMNSISFHFEPLVKKGLLKIVSTRPSFFGLEMHLLEVYKIIADFKPQAVVMDP